MSGNYEKLPKWAQREIEALHRKIKSLNSDLMDIVCDRITNGSRVWVRGSAGEKLYLPHQSTIHINTPGDGEIVMKIEDHGALIQAYGGRSHASTLFIQPVVTNSARILMLKEDER